MRQTIFITGASSGIGKETAKFFQLKGWNIVATMRNPENETELIGLENVFVTKLDVLDLESINQAITKGIEKFGGIDVLLNNAGYGAYGPLESFPREMTFPLGSLYHGTKFAVEGISESLRYEVEQFGGKVKIIEPGAIATDFAGRSFDFNNDEKLSAYQNIVGKIMAAFPQMIKNASSTNVVTEVIYEAATDGTNRLRYMAGKDAKLYNLLNKLFGYGFLFKMNKKFFKL